MLRAANVRKIRSGVWYVSSCSVIAETCKFLWFWNLWQFMDLCLVRSWLKFRWSRLYYYDDMTTRVGCKIKMKRTNWEEFGSHISPTVGFGRIPCLAMPCDIYVATTFPTFNSKWYVTISTHSKENIFLNFVMCRMLLGFFLRFERASTWQIMKTARFMCCRQIMVLFPLQEFWIVFFLLQTLNLKSHSHICVFAKCALTVSHVDFLRLFFANPRELYPVVEVEWKKQIKRKKNQLNTHWVHVYPNSMVDVSTLTSTIAAPH